MPPNYVFVPPGRNLHLACTLDTSTPQGRGLLRVHAVLNKVSWLTLQGYMERYERHTLGVAFMTFGLGLPSIYTGSHPLSTRFQLRRVLRTATLRPFLEAKTVLEEPPVIELTGSMVAVVSVLCNLFAFCGYLHMTQRLVITDDELAEIKAGFIAMEVWLLQTIPMVTTNPTGAPDLEEVS